MGGVTTGGMGGSYPKTKRSPAASPNVAVPGINNRT